MRVFSGGRRRIACASVLLVGLLAGAAALAPGASAGGGPALGMGPAHWYGPNGTFGEDGGVAGPIHAQAPIHALTPDNLSNPSNNPVMLATRTHVIFWLPPGFHYSGGNDAAYESTVLKYFQDVGGSQILNTATQYTGNNGTVSDSSTFVDSVVDTTAFPHTGADVAHAVSQADINQEVFNQIGAHSWPFGLGDMYFVFLPDNLVDCDSSGTSCNTNAYCAYHTYGTSGSNDFVWADIPDNRSVYSAGGCGDSNVTGNESADTTLSSVEHEHLEAITDPLLNAWRDSTGAENGDKCNRNMGVANGQPAVANNYLGAGNADLFRIQREWSNAAALATSNAAGCAASYTTTGSHVVAPAPSGGDVVNAVAEATIPGNPADTLHYTLTFTNPSNQDDAYGVQAAVTLPAGLGGGTVNLSIGNLAPHQTGTATFTAHPSGWLAAGTTLTASAVFSFDDSTGTAAPTITRTATTTVVNAPPVLSVPGPQSGDFNDPLSFGVSATDANAGDTLTFGASGLPAGLTLTDNGNRTATIAGTISDVPGVYTATITVDDHHNTTVSQTVSITVTREEAILAYNGPLTVHYHDALQASATLVDPDGGAPIAAKSITFTLGGGGDTCTAATDGSGTATCAITPHVTGSQGVTAAFAGDTYYVPANDSKTVAITPEETTMAYTGPKVILAGSGGATLTATMVEDGTADSEGDGGSPAPVPAETVTLSIGSQSCTGVTDGSGHVTCTIPSVTVPLGPVTVGASFAGDAFYQRSSDSASAIVFAFPSRGAFVLGDTTAATAGSSTVTWWSDSWWQLDTLTGGVAPAAFKGFAAVVTLPTTTPATTCGSAWTTGGGNSPPPASGVPSYMGVVVASKVTKSGTTISGNSVHIVVVRTNPGYAPNPQSAGTGTIVATFC